MKKMKLNHLLFRFSCMAAFILFVGVALLVSTPNLSIAEEQTKIVFRNAFRPLSNWGPYWVAQSRYWPEEGVAGQVQDGKGSADAIKAVAAGSAQMGCAQVATVMGAIQKGLPIKILLIAEQKDPTAITTLKENGIKELKGFEGKTLSVFPFGTVGPLVKAMLKQNNIDISKITFRNVPPGNEIPLLLTKKVDAVCGMAGTHDTEVIAKGKKEPIVFMIQDYGISIPANAVIVNTKWENEVGRDVVLKYVRGIIKGFTLSKSNAKEMLADMIKYRPEQKNLYDLRLGQCYPLWLYRYKSDVVEKNGFGWIDETIMVEAQDVLIKAGFIKEKMDVKKYYTLDYLNDKSVKPLAMKYVKTPLDPNLKGYYEKVLGKK